MTHILAIDQGTTSSRAILFDASLRPVASAQEEFPQHYPRPGWVEHDPADLWSTVAATARAAIEKAGTRATDIAAIGITNQRETTLIWDRATGNFTSDDSGPINAYNVSGAGAEYTFNVLKGCSLGAQVNNLYNERYMNVASRPMPGRNYNMYMIFKF